MFALNNHRIHQLNWRASCYVLCDYALTICVSLSYKYNLWCVSDVISVLCPTAHSYVGYREWKGTEACSIRSIVDILYLHYILYCMQCVLLCRPVQPIYFSAYLSYILCTCVKLMYLCIFLCVYKFAAVSICTCYICAMSCILLSSVCISFLFIYAL